MSDTQKRVALIVALGLIAASLMAQASAPTSPPRQQIARRGDRQAAKGERLEFRGVRNERRGERKERQGERKERRGERLEAKGK